MQWQNIETKGKIPCPMYGSSMLEQAGKLYFFGGYKENGDCSSDLFEYDIGIDLLLTTVSKYREIYLEEVKNSRYYSSSSMLSDFDLV